MLYCILRWTFFFLSFLCAMCATACHERKERDLMYAMTFIEKKAFVICIHSIHFANERDALEDEWQ
jgi:hypothetical protein